ncbi:MAG: OsmC family peroxiredoxin [Thaumarchaeota archaeon]|nr:MAG: OsmC family peroxiredoxin [Nitrososphaerota archaeon]
MPVMKARSIWIGKYRSVLDNLRGHSVVVDLPPAKNGEDTGATALELAVMALAGCVTTIFKIVAEKRKLDYKNLNVVVEAEQPEGEKTITNFKAALEIETDAKKEDVERVLRLTLDICPVGLIFDKAGIKGEWEVKVRSPT